MISVTDISLTLFLMLLSVHLGLSMDFFLVSTFGVAFSLVGGLFSLGIKRPTWDLLILLLIAGAIFGNTMLEDIAANGSWVQYMGAPAGIYLALLIFMLWLLAERPKNANKAPMDRSAQTITSLGLIILLMVPVNDLGNIVILDTRIPWLQMTGLLLTIIAYSANRPSPSPRLLHRLLLLSPLLLIVLVLVPALSYIQAPLFSLLGPITPNTRDYAQSGFSPLQRLNSRVFMQPSTRPALRVKSDSLSSRYLVGNRLSILDDNLIWQPADNSNLKLTADSNKSLSNGYNHFSVANHHFNVFPGTGALTIYSLKRQQYLFLPPGSSTISGNFNGLSRDVNQVWSASFEKNASRSWDVTTAVAATPETVNQTNLTLPSFWDRDLNNKSIAFKGEDRPSTVQNIKRYFNGRGYSLKVDFDSDKPLQDFFLNDKPAFCFWFATTTTLALRANGIPSRLVSGYLIHEKIASDLWLVRERDAHSWVEWQDQLGFWHTLDPTPPAIDSFFGNYQSSVFSRWYHVTANQAQAIIDLILSDDLIANIVRISSLLILLFLFGREYRRIKSNTKNIASQQWNRLWNQFIGTSKLPDNNTWTVATYLDNLPDVWTQGRKSAAQKFLLRYNEQRFSQHSPDAAQEMEHLLSAFRKTQ